MLKVISKRTLRFEGNAYLLYEEESREAALIDCDYGAECFAEMAKELYLQVRYILLTHGHYDHTGAALYLKGVFGAPVCIGVLDGEMLTDASLSLSAYADREWAAFPADRLLSDGERLPLGASEIQVIHTPGHTRGSTCYMTGDCLFSGDTLFADTIGVTHFPGGNIQLMKDSLEKLAVLPSSLHLYPGHNEEGRLGDALHRIGGICL